MVRRGYKQSQGDHMLFIKTFYSWKGICLNCVYRLYVVIENDLIEIGIL